MIFLGAVCFHMSWQHLWLMHFIEFLVTSVILSFCSICQDQIILCGEVVFSLAFCPADDFMWRSAFSLALHSAIYCLFGSSMFLLQFGIQIWFRWFSQTIVAFCICLGWKSRFGERLKFDYSTINLTFGRCRFQCNVFAFPSQGRSKQNKMQITWQNQDTSLCVVWRQGLRDHVVTWRCCLWVLGRGLGFNQFLTSSQIVQPEP